MNEFKPTLFYEKYVFRYKEQNLVYYQDDYIQNSERAVTK